MNYYVACFLMSLGISMDVMLATISRSRSFENVRCGMQWLYMITATHILFPMIGYYGFSVLYKIAPSASVLLGLAGSTLLGYFVVNLFLSWLKEEKGEQETARLRRVNFLLVLAVSWDALFSGPAKSAQAVKWDAIEILVSFGITGIFVFLFGLCSVYIAVYVNRKYLRERSCNITTLTRNEVFAKYIELAILTYFFTLALVRYVFALDGYDILLLSLSLLICGILFYCYRDRIWNATRRDVVYIFKE